MLKAENHGTISGFDAWLPEPGAPAFIGLDRTRVSVAFTREYVPAPWHHTIRRRIAAWLLRGVAE